MASWHDRPRQPLLLQLRLLAQRAARWMPPRLRSALRRAVPAPAAEVRLDGWEHPLAGDPGAVLRWPAAPEPDDAPEGAGPRPVAAALRCLLVTESLDAGGMDEFVAFLAQGLPAHGVTTAVLTAPMSERPAQGAIAAQLRGSGVEIFDATGQIEAGTEWMRRFAPDVVAVHGDATWPVEVARAAGIPAALVLHGVHDLLGRSPAEVVARHRLFSLVICVSDAVREHYLGISADIDGDRVITIPNGVRPRPAVDRAAARAALGLTDEVLFLSLSRHALQKNVYGLVSAFDDVARTVPRAHLLVCGRPDDAEYTHQVLGLRDRLASRDRIHLRSGTDRVDVLIGAADAFVLDSFFEGWALASMEALAAGVPVISSDVGGAREQLEGAPRRGVLVPHPLGSGTPLDWESISRARFAPQPNRAALVDAMTRFAQGRLGLADASEIAVDAAVRFDLDLCVARHARALSEMSAPAAAGSREVSHADVG